MEMEQGLEASSAMCHEGGIHRAERENPDHSVTMQRRII